MSDIKLLEKKLKKIPTDQLYQYAVDEQKSLGLESLYYHNKYILGYKDMEAQPHLEMCEFIQTWGENLKKLLIGPRGCFKSSNDVIGYALHEIVKNPDIKILIVGETFGNATTYLRGIKLHLQANARFKEVYSHLFKDYEFDVWREEAINLITKGGVKRKDDDVFACENTIDLAGIGTSKVGMHYDLIFFVDPHSQQTVNTPEQIMKVISYYRLLNPIRKSGTGRIIIEMTRWHHFDLAWHIQEKENSQFDFYIRSAYNEDKSLFFPEVLTQKVLDDELAAMGSYLFSCQYLSDPQSDSTKPFKPENVSFYTPDQLPENVEKWVLLDPSISEKANADDFALLGLGIDRTNNNQYSLGHLTINRKLPAQAVAEVMAFLEENYHNQPIYRVAIETVAFQRIYKFELERELSKRGKPYQVVELKPGARAKKQRIMGLQPFYETHKMFLRRGEPGQESPDMDILMQFDKFPLNLVDGKCDFIDTWAYVLDLLNVKKEFDKQNQKMKTFQNRLLAIKRSGKQSSLRRKYS